MFERFTDRARRVVVLAQEEARHLEHDSIGTEHLLLGLLGEPEGVAARALGEVGISLEACRARVEEVIGRGTRTLEAGNIPFTASAKTVLELSLREALNLGHNYIGTEHLLLGLIREKEGVAARVLVQMGAELPAVRQTVVALVERVVGERRAGRPAAAAPPPEETVEWLEAENRRLREEVERLREALRRMGGDSDPAG